MPAIKLDPSDSIPLLDFDEPDAVFTWHHGAPVTRREFVYTARALAKRLPSHAFAINLCENRYHFLLAFAAVLLAGQSNLLPANKVAREIDALASRYPDSHQLTDDAMASALERLEIIHSGSSDASAEVPRIPRDHVAATVFTSGSTGAAQAHEKRWGNLVIGARLARRCFGLDRFPRVAIIATVPPQHMFGLETSVLLPLVGGLRVHTGRPFYPLDILCALKEVSPPRVLITTPLHLRACVNAGLDWPIVDGIVSSTAPLPADLASRAEQTMSSPVWEIYGCTETGFIASRRTTKGQTWKLLEGVRMKADGDDLWVRGPQIPAPVQLHDFLDLHGNSEFTLLGRQSDLVKVAGQRASLADLNHKLTGIEGVEDGVIFVPQQTTDPVTRVAGLVVAPQLSVDAILTELTQRVDRVFLPRPLYRVSHLPRTETGKLPQRELMNMFHSMRKVES